MNIETVKENIEKSYWEDLNIPERFKPEILKWLQNSRNTILDYGWPCPKIEDAINKLINTNEGLRKN
jgi:hypothetical protein